MSNILLDSLPEAVTVDGEELFVDTDFRTFIIFEKLLGEELPADEMIDNVISLFFADEKPKNYEEAIDRILYLYRCGEDKKPKKAVKKNGSVELKQAQIYDFEHDAPYIYAAFLTQYGIDLNDIEYLHWWKFQALFRSLEASRKIVEIMGYRAADLGSIKDKTERSRIATLKSLYALPQNLTREDKIAMAGAAFGGGFS